MKITSIDGGSYILFNKFKKETESSIVPLFLTSQIDVKIANLFTSETISFEKTDLHHIIDGITNILSNRVSKFSYTDLDEQISLNFEIENDKEIFIKGVIRDIEYVYNLSFELYTNYEILKSFLNDFSINE